MSEGHYRCAWCNSSRTHFVRVRYWEEDEYHPADEETMTPQDQEWWCDDCDDGFIVDIDEEDAPDERT